MNNYNFDSCDLLASSEYDGFLDTEGNYYIVGKKPQASMEMHHEWAKQFMKNKKIKVSYFNQTYSMLLSLSKLKGPADYLIHCCGYVYYSHDPIFLKPIILLPKPEYAGKKASPSQIESLYKIMLINNENPLDKEILIDSNIYEYTGLDDMEGKVR